MPPKTAVETGDSRVDKAFELISRMGPEELRALNEAYCKMVDVPLPAAPTSKVRPEPEEAPTVEESPFCMVKLVKVNPDLVINTIKAIRKALHIDLGSARDLVYAAKSAPVTIALGFPRAEAEALKKSLRELGVEAALQDTWDEPTVTELDILLHREPGQPAILCSLQVTRLEPWQLEKVSAVWVEPDNVYDQPRDLAVFNDHTAGSLIISELQRVFGPDPLLLRTLYDGILSGADKLGLPLQT